MKARLRWTYFGLLLAVTFCVNSVQAQTAQPAASPKKSVSTPRASAWPSIESRQTAPQVVTILHRLNGLKMFRLMVRGDQQMGAIAQLDDAFKILGDVHTNVIAGLALSDGQTIVARMPELEAELAPAASYFAPGFPTAPLPTPPEKPKDPLPPSPPSSEDFFQTPDVSVIVSGGQRVVARYIGFDAVSGLSVLKIDDKTLLPAIEVKAPQLSVGQHLRLFGPEPAAPSAFGGKISVKVGESEGMITNLTEAPSGSIYRLRVKAPRLSAASIGSVAVNDAGDTVGIIVGIGKGEASVLPNAQIRNAVRRVTERQASVPRPWLGVSGEPIAAMAPDRLLSNGWLERQALALTQARRGILLTNVMPDSPAAVAALHAGDVILTVNGGDIRSADDFSWHLEEVGPGGSVNFTVMRPGGNETQDVKLKLSGVLDSTFAFPRNVNASAFLLRQSLLAAQGIESVELKPQVAARLGASRGLLVIFVQPDSEAFKAGLLAGDVIEAIDGQQASLAPRNTASTSSAMRFDVVRAKQRLVIRVANIQK